MHKTISRAGYVRRIDALLRARYPYLSTQIFETTRDKFEIVFDSTLQNWESISNEFHESIRFMTVHVNLSNTRPNSYLRAIPQLSDEDATGEMVGLPLRRIDLVNFLVSRFPDAGIVDVRETDGNQGATIVVKHDLDAVVQSEIMSFVYNLSLPVVFTIAVSSDRQTNATKIIDDPMYIWASGLRPYAPSFVRKDEEFWFDNIHNISANKLPIDRFPGMGDGMFRCYIDLTLGEQHVNLRQALLLYDEVWCSLPLQETHESFLEQQGLTEADLLHAAECGRLRFLTTQPEERLRIPFLEEVYERKSTAILGRRTTAALLVADVSQMAEMSFLSDASVVSALVELGNMVSEVEGVARPTVLRGFLWPLASRRDGLQGLLDRGSKAGPAMRLAELVSARLHAKTGLDCQLESMVFSEAVHISHALNATLFGPLTEVAWEI